MSWGIQCNGRGTAQARHLHVTVSQGLGGPIAQLACMAPHICILHRSQLRTNSCSLSNLTNNRRYAFAGSHEDNEWVVTMKACFLAGDPCSNNNASNHTLTFIGFVCMNMCVHVCCLCRALFARP
jgi:hypothetical protein